MLGNITQRVLIARHSEPRFNGPHKPK